MSLSSVPILRLSCPACGGCVEVPLPAGDRFAPCPHCATSVAVPEIIGLLPSDPAGGEPRRDLKVRTPAMPGSRQGPGNSKEPLRLPKPGEAPASEGPAPILLVKPNLNPVIPLPPVAEPLVLQPPLPPAPAAPVALSEVHLPSLPPPPAPSSTLPVIVPLPPDWRKKSTLRSQALIFTPVIAATLLCSAAVAAWRVWPASFGFTYVAEPDNELLYHYQPPTTRRPLSESSKSAPNLFEEFASEGFHFKAPTDYWERLPNAASPFSLLQPAFTLRRTESSPPSEFGIASCDFAIATEALPPGAEIGDVWQNLAAVSALRARFPCGMPENYEISSTGPQACRFLRLVWEVLPGEGGNPARHLEMWVHQRGGIAWSLTGMMPGTTTSYALTRTMQRLAEGFSPLDADPELTRISLRNRDMTGASPLNNPPVGQLLHRWTALPPGTMTWPGGQRLTPGAETTWAVGPARIALITLPADGLEKIQPSRLLTGLRQLWPALRGFSIPVLDPDEVPDGKTLRVLLAGNFDDSPAQCLVHWRRSPQGTVLAFVFQPNAESGPTPDPAFLLTTLDLKAGAPGTGSASLAPSAIHLPLLEALAGEARADGRPGDASAFHFALFARSQRMEDLASACGSLAAGGQLEEAIRQFDQAGEPFTHTPGWELYRTLVLARLGAGPRAHRHAMDLLSSGRFPGSLAAPYLNALMESKSWPQAKAFASMLVRNDPDSALWRLHYATILAETGERTKAIAIIQATQQTWPDDAMLGIECVQTLLRLKCLQDALGTAGRVALAHPGHEQANLLWGQCQTLLGRNEEARIAYQLALKAAPASQAAREAITSLATLSAQSDKAFVTGTIDPVPLPAALFTGLPGAPDHSIAPAVVLSRITGLRHQRGRLPATTVRSRILINNAEGMSQWNTLTFPIDPARERLALHHLNVLDPKGKIIARGSLADRYTLDAADGTRLVHFPIPGLVPGCTIDYAVTTENTGPASTWPYIRHAFALSSPCLADICYVTGDTSSLTWAHSQNRQPWRSGDSLIWREDRPALLTGSQTTAPMLHLGTVSATWESVGRDYLEQIRHRLANDPAILQAATRYTKGLTSRSDKIDALARRVRSDISYTAIEFGYRAIIPHAAGVTLNNRFGDCKDHAVLLHGLLTAAGIPSFPALIHSSLPTHPDFPALSQFDHMIVAIPAANGKFDFIDPTDKFLEATPGAAPTGLASRQALILDPAKPRLAATPDIEAASSGTLQRQVSLMDDRDATIIDQLTLTGPVAANFRALLAPLPPGGHLAALQRLLGLDRLREQLLEVTLTSLRDPSRPLEARLVWLSREALRPAPGGQHLFLSSPLADYLLCPPAFNEASASQALRITAPLHLEASVAVVAPQGLALSVPLLPHPEGTRPQGSWTSSAQGNTLSWKADLRVGSWKGTDAAAASRFPVDALQPLRQPWFLAKPASAFRPSPSAPLPVISGKGAPVLPNPAPGKFPSQN